MERNASNRRVVFLIIGFLLVGGASHAQTDASYDGSNYSQINIELTVNYNQFYNDSLTFDYDMGYGLAVEREYFYNRRLSFLTNGGSNVYNSTSSSANVTTRIIAMQARFGTKYYFFDKTALYGGVMGYYGFLLQNKRSSIGNWKTIDDENQMGAGIFCGLDISLKSWASLRTWYSIMNQIGSFQVSIVITPSILIQ